MINPEGSLFKPELLSVLSVCQKACGELMDQMEAKSLSFELDIAEKLCLRVDPRMLDAILRILITNALTFTGNRGKIILTANEEHSGVRFTLRDNGVGMTEATRKALFSDHLNGSEKSEEEEKLRHGFHLARRYIELHGGHVDVRSTIGHGTIVSFKLPTE